MEEPRHINITADKENPDDGVQKILKEIRPNWSKKDVTLEVMLEQCRSLYMNRVFS